MKIKTLKRQKMIPQLEAAHIGAMRRLRRAYPCPESQEVLDRVDQVTVELSERMGTCAGRAWTRRLNGRYYLGEIRLNARLLAINEDELIPTYLHELAHIVANLIHEKQCGHGRYWRSVMRILGESDERYHSMDVSAFQRPQKRFAYSCVKCEKTFDLTIKKHKKQQHQMIEGIGAYICKCGGRLEHNP